MMIGQTLRVIDQLRRMMPGKWRYASLERHWVHESGVVVRAYAQMAPRHDSDDDTFVTVYRRTDTGEQLLIWQPRRRHTM